MTPGNSTSPPRSVFCSQPDSAQSLTRAGNTALCHPLSTSLFSEPPPQVSLPALVDVSGASDQWESVREAKERKKAKVQGWGEKAASDESAVTPSIRHSDSDFRQNK